MVLVKVSKLVRGWLQPHPELGLHLTWSPAHTPSACRHRPPTTSRTHTPHTGSHAHLPSHPQCLCTPMFILTRHSHTRPHSLPRSLAHSRTCPLTQTHFLRHNQIHTHTLMCVCAHTSREGMSPPSTFTLCSPSAQEGSQQAASLSFCSP